jgi:DNA-binding transcriptional ArsR family regulator
MTQAARPQIPWIVELPANDITGYSRSSFISACQGHEKMGDLLAYFLLIASHEAKDQNIDTMAKDCTFIDISCKYENIAKKVKISRKSLGNHLKQLETLGYIEAPPYQRVYRIYFKKVEAAIKSPPDVVKAKPRGKYAPPTEKPTQEEKNTQKRLVLQQKLVNLQQKVVSLQNKVVTLQKELVNLQPFETDEATPGQGLEGNFEPLRVLQSLLDNIEDSLVTSANAESDGGASFLSQLRSFEETLKEVQNGQTPLDVSCSPEEYNQEEPVKEADTSKTPAVTSAVNDTTPLQEIPTPEQPTEPLFPAAQSLPSNKTHKKDHRKISVLFVPKVPPRVIREAIDAIRGYALDQEGPIKHQGVILKEWCQKHTLEDFQHVIEHLTKGRCSNEKHQWWREKNHMKTFFNAAKLAELTPDILSELGHIPKPEAPPEVAPSVEEPKIVGWTPVQRIYPRNGETVTYG